MELVSLHLSQDNNNLTQPLLTEPHLLSTQPFLTEPNLIPFYFKKIDVKIPIYFIY